MNVEPGMSNLEGWECLCGHVVCGVASFFTSSFGVPGSIFNIRFLQART